MQALLVRVGIDGESAKEEWRAPMNPVTREFAYVPIPENNRIFIPRYKISYERFKDTCWKLGRELPPKFSNDFKYKYAHLDPDFEKLTYGDIDEKPEFRERCIKGKKRLNHRGEHLLDLVEDDILVFYASLDPGRWKKNQQFLPLDYAIIGIYVLKEPPERATEDYKKNHDLGMNAHTRVECNEADIIACGKGTDAFGRKISGRLDKCIQIGEWIRKNGDKGKAYWLKQCLFDEWGGFEDVKKNRLCIIRSPKLWKFNNADKFYDWFKEQLVKENIRLINDNN